MKKLIGKYICYWLGRHKEKVVDYEIKEQMEKPNKTYPKGSFLYRVTTECSRCGLSEIRSRTGCPDCIETGIRH